MSTLTLRERAAEYLGPNNVSRLKVVPLGRERIAFVGPGKLWIYEEVYAPRAVVVNLSETMARNLIDALVEAS